MGMISKQESFVAKKAAKRRGNEFLKMWDGIHHRHLSNIDCLMLRNACLVCFISTVNSCSKKRSLGRLALVAGT